jgi:hypothetical protein
MSSISGFNVAPPKMVIIQVITSKKKKERWQMVSDLECIYSDNYMQQNGPQRLNILFSPKRKLHMKLFQRKVKLVSCVECRFYHNIKRELSSL